MEADLIAKIKAALPTIKVYHDVAPNDAAAPYVVIQRVGGAGHQYLDYQTSGAYQVRLQVAVWAADRLSANRHSRAIESTILELPTTAPIGAAVAAHDPDADLFGMRQDFYCLE